MEEKWRSTGQVKGELVKERLRDFPGGPMVKSLCF